MVLMIYREINQMSQFGELGRREWWVVSMVLRILALVLKVRTSFLGASTWCISQLGSIKPVSIRRSAR